MARCAHSAQPERGIETTAASLLASGVPVLIQHNPNEGLKRPGRDIARWAAQCAHSAQPERGIETAGLPGSVPWSRRAHSAQPERGIETTPAANQEQP